MILKSCCNTDFASTHISYFNRRGHGRGFNGFCKFYFDYWLQCCAIGRMIKDRSIEPCTFYSDWFWSKDRRRRRSFVTARNDKQYQENETGIIKYVSQPYLFFKKISSLLFLATRSSFLLAAVVIHFISLISPSKF